MVKSMFEKIEEKNEKETSELKHSWPEIVKHYNLSMLDPVGTYTELVKYQKMGWVRTLRYQNRSTRP